MMRDRAANGTGGTADQCAREDWASRDGHDGSARARADQSA
jgi:hypothetical protein